VCGTCVTYLVVMDRPNTKSGGMPRSFYRRLVGLEGVVRIQKSVYLVTCVSNLKQLVDLGRRFDFQVRSFRVVEEIKNECQKGVIEKMPRDERNEVM